MGHSDSHLGQVERICLRRREERNEVSPQSRRRRSKAGYASGFKADSRVHTAAQLAAAPADERTRHPTR